MREVIRFVSGRETDGRKYLQYNSDLAHTNLSLAVVDFHALAWYKPGEKSEGIVAVLSEKELSLLTGNPGGHA